MFEIHLSMWLMPRTKAENINNFNIVKAKVQSPNGLNGDFKTSKIFQKY